MILRDVCSQAHTHTHSDTIKQTDRQMHVYLYTHFTHMLLWTNTFFYYLFLFYKTSFVILPHRKRNKHTPAKHKELYTHRHTRTHTCILYTLANNLFREFQSQTRSIVVTVLAQQSSSITHIFYLHQLHSDTNHSDHSYVSPVEQHTLSAYPVTHYQ